MPGSLTCEQKQHLIEQGYVHLPGAAREAVDVARRAIHASIGEHGIDPARLSEFRAQSYCPEIKDSPAVTDLFNATPVCSMAEAFIGRGRIKPVASGQIALRFSRLAGKRKQPAAHIDGIATSTNGVLPGTLHSFTMLVGVLLSDVPEPFSGNFTVFPGTHHKMAAYFRDHGDQEILNGKMPWVDPGEALQITGKAGDVVFAHYLLQHGSAANFSSDIRYAVFFRLRHVDLDGYRPESLRDPWLEWEGLHSMLGRG